MLSSQRVSAQLAVEWTGGRDVPDDISRKRNHCHPGTRRTPDSCYAADLQVAAGAHITAHFSHNCFNCNFNTSTMALIVSSDLYLKERGPKLSPEDQGIASHVLCPPVALRGPIIVDSLDGLRGAHDSCSFEVKDSGHAKQYLEDKLLVVIGDDYTITFQVALSHVAQMSAKTHAVVKSTIQAVEILLGETIENNRTANIAHKVMWQILD